MKPRVLITARFIKGNEIHYGYGPARRLWGFIIVAGKKRRKLKVA